MDTSHYIEEQFLRFYTDESDAIFRFCLIRTSDREVALDLSQETFMRLWDTLSNRTEIRNIRAFLFTVARHLVIDWYRKKKPQSLEALAGESEDIDQVIPMVDNMQGEIEMNVEGRYLIDKINELPPVYREVVYLRFVEGLPPKEIGEIVGKSVGAVSVSIHRGIEKLRELTGYQT